MATGTERVGILFKALGAKGVIKDAKDIDNAIRKINRQKVGFNLGGKSYGQLEQLRNRLKLVSKEAKTSMGDVKREIAKLRNTKVDFKGLSPRVAWQQENKRLGKIMELEAKLGHIKENKATLDADIARIENQMKLTPELDLKGWFRQGKSVMGAIGTSLETIGNGITQLARNPITEIFTGMFRQLGVGLTSLMYQGFSDSINRFDTFRTFPKIMQQMFGKTDEVATKAGNTISYLNESVLGLPTSLADITSSAQRYISIMRDIDKGSKLAVASNNAFLSSFSDENQRYLGERQLNRLATGTKLTAIQWNSLINSMPNAITEVGKKMGYDLPKEFIAELKANKIDGQDFLDAFIEVGSTGVVHDMAQEMVDTMTASIENIKNAFSRMGAGVFEVVDEALLSTTGKGLPKTIKDITLYIDDLSKQAKGWIKANPQVIKGWVDTIKSIDFTGFLKGMGKGVIESLNTLMKFVKIFARNESTLGRILGKAPVYGRLVTFIGQMIKGFSPIGGLFNVLLNLAKYKIAGNVIAGRGMFSGLMPKFLQRVDKTAEAIESTPPPKAGKIKVFTSGFKSLARGLLSIVGIAGTLVAVTGSILAMSKMIKAIGDTKINWNGAVGKLIGFGTFIGVLTGFAIKFSSKVSLAFAKDLGIFIGVIGGAITAISGLVTLNTWLLKKSVQNIKEMVDGLNEISASAGRLSWNSGGFGRVTDALWEISDMLDELGFFNTLDDKWTSSNIQTLVTNLKDTMQDFVDIGNMLSTLKVPDEDSLGVVTDIAEFMGRFYQEFDGLINTPTRYGYASKLSEKDTEKAKNITDNFNQSITSIMQIVESLAQGRSTINKLFQKNGMRSKKGTVLTSMREMIKDVFEELGTIYEEIDLQFGAITGGRAGKWEKIDTEEIKKKVDEISESMTSISGIVETLGAMRSNTNKLFLKNGQRSKKGTVLTSLREQIKDIFEELGAIFNTFKTSFTGKLSGTWINIKEPKKMLGQIKTALESVSAIAKELSSMRSTTNKLFLDNGQGSKKGTVLTSLRTQIENIFTELGSIFSAFDVAMGDNFDSTKASADMLNIQHAMHYISSIVGYVNNLPAKMENMNFGRHGNMDTFFANLNAVFQGIAQVVNTLETEIPDTAGLEEKFTAVQHTMDKIKSIVGYVANMNTQMAEGGGIPASGEIPVISAIRNLVTNLKNALGGAEGTQGLLLQVALFEQAMNRLKIALSGLSVEGFAGFIGTLQGIGKALDNVTKKFNSAGKQWRSGLLKGLNLSGLVGQINSALNNVLGQRNYFMNGFTTGMSFGRGLQAGINAISIDTSGLNAKVSGAVAQVTSMALRFQGLKNMFRSQGGMVYASKGQLINFQPKGTDTVPAMLTPGEFVQRRSAVNHFGTKFMERINALDLNGALNSLSLKATSLAMPSGSTTIINNTKNNNAQVTQHMNVRNTKTSFIHANRYVRSL